MRRRFVVSSRVTASLIGACPFVDGVATAFVTGDPVPPVVGRIRESARRISIDRLGGTEPDVHGVPVEQP